MNYINRKIETQKKNNNKKEEEEEEDSYSHEKSCQILPSTILHLILVFYWLILAFLNSRVK